MTSPRRGAASSRVPDCRVNELVVSVRAMKVRAPFRWQTDAVKEVGKFSEMGVKAHGILVDCVGSAFLIAMRMELR